MAETKDERSPTPPGAALQAETQPEDGDSLYDSAEEASSYLSSLKSSIYNYRFDNGRRYHAFREGTYLVHGRQPNDDEEQNRMDLVHHIYSLVLDGKLHLAPIGKSPQRVLDLGTGTGIWAIDFAETPPNCFFEVDDFEDDWVYKKPFDYIHGRELEGCIGDDEKLFKKAFDNLSSGGYFELQAQRGCFLSDDGTHEKAANAQRWAAGILEGSGKFGKPIDCAHQWKDELIKVGFVDVQEEIRKVQIPIGPWPKDPKLKEIGKYQSVQTRQAIDSYTPKLFGAVLGWSNEEIEVIMAQAKKELQDRSVHLYLPVHIMWGRKP
ncbi:hypothetical protein Neosp_009522 [[Neocosmospora] mangrovei]